MTKRFLTHVFLIALLCISLVAFSSCDILAELGLPIGGVTDENVDDNDTPDGDISEGDKEEELPPHEHSYVATVTSPTCVSEGYTTYTCECGEEYVADQTDALGHEFSEYVFDANSTCTEDGTETASCANPGCVATDTRVRLDSKTDHVFTECVVSEGYFKAEATCSSGSIYYKSCVCGLMSDSETFENDDLLPHPKEDSWTFDDTYHWIKATCECGVVLDKEEHVVDADGCCTVCDKLVLPTDGIVYTLSTDETYYIVSDYTGTATRVKIADTYNSLPVKVIDSNAFANCRSLTSIEIPYGITEIAANAFSNCSGLKSLVIPDSVEKMGLGALYGCSGLVEITVPFTGDFRKTSEEKYQYPFGYIFGTLSYNNSVATEQSFYKNSTSYTGTTTYYLPASLEKVTVTGGELLFGAFYACENLTTVIIGDDVTAIRNRVFYYCYGLENVTIGSSVTHIGSYAFYYCQELTEVVVPDSVTYIGMNAFDRCYKLAKITLPFVGQCVGATKEAAPFGYIFGYTKLKNDNGTVTDGTYQYVDVSGAPVTIYTYYYHIPTSLREVVITGGGDIGSGLIRNCIYITTLTFGDEVTSIGESALYGCYDLNTVVISASVKTINRSAFKDCKDLTTIVFMGTMYEWECISKGAGWNEGVPAIEVICTDGVITL